MDEKLNQPTGAIHPSIDTFKRANTKMVATNDHAYSGTRWTYHAPTARTYTEEEIDRIVNSGSLDAQIKLSRDFFNRDGLYKTLVIYYATLLKYVGILIPNPSFGQNLSTPYTAKRYRSAIDLIDSMNLRIFFTDCAMKALRDGCYYGIKVKTDSKNHYMLDLPPAYCRTRFKDVYGNDIIEFNLGYFYSIMDETERKSALSTFPDYIQSAWRKIRKLKSQWYIIPAEDGICFPFLGGRPYFLNVIKQCLRYDDAIELDRERNLEEIRKILVQKVPHLTDGRLLFEPDEAAEMHAGAVQMLKGNKNLSVLTTYTDVDAITSKTTADSTTDNVIQKMYQNIYSTSGTSSELFASTGSSTLGSSVAKDIGMMMTLADRFARYVTFTVNKECANSNISFKYMILPVSWQNESDYIADSFKLASSGYSFLVPAIAQGFTQRDLGNIKELENSVLKLQDKLVPLASSYTQSGKASTDEGGRPELDDDQKSEKTIQNEKSLDNQTGGSE